MGYRTAYVNGVSITERVYGQSARMYIDICSHEQQWSFRWIEEYEKQYCIPHIITLTVVVFIVLSTDSTAVPADITGLVQ